MNSTALLVIDIQRGAFDGQRCSPIAEPDTLLDHAVSLIGAATEMREYFLRIGAPEWETAFVHVIHAHSAAAAGAREQHISSYELATAAPAEAIQDEEERSIVSKTFGHVPAP
jgi:hypothetical protein